VFWYSYLRNTTPSQIGLPNIEIIPSSFAENIPKAGLTPIEYCLKTASAKAIATYTSELEASSMGRLVPGELQKREPELIIAADTIVVGPNGIILEKPRSERQHVEMLKLLRDGTVRTPGIKEPVQTGGLGFGGEMLELGSGFRGEGAGMGRGRNGGESIGYCHKVYTAVAVLAPLESARDPGYTLETAVEETGVYFDAESRYK
jgi:septum formation protein